MHFLLLRREKDFSESLEVMGESDAVECKLKLAFESSELILSLVVFLLEVIKSF